MCGIAGFIDRVNREEADSLIKSMLDRLARRGPDGAGHWIDDLGDGWVACLGHRRLSIIDLSMGKQPLGNEDGSLMITFNGEIFNFQDLHRQLVGKGHVFGTKSDTEVIVHQFEERGLDAFKDLNGMFALGLWDRKSKNLVLSRDRAGIKPLYYVRLPSGGIAFASELTALIAHPRVGRDLNLKSMVSYFFGDSIPSPEAALDGVSKLEPGAFLKFDFKSKKTDHGFFWQVSENLDSDGFDWTKANDDRMADELWEHLRVAVRRQLVADVPVGAFLSGGIDSSIVTTLAREEIGDQLQTFSIGFEDKDYDEAPHARLMARKLGTRHTELVLSEKNLLDNVRESFTALDEPLADPSILPTYLLSRMAREHVKVVIGGDGGDELWAGYPTYRAHGYSDVYERIPQAIRKRVIAPVVRRLPVNPTYQSLEWKAKRFVLRWDQDPIRRHLRWMSNSDLESLSSVFGGRDFAEPLLLKRAHFPKCNDKINRLLALDFTTYMPNSVLTKVDRASMANGLEVRPPFLDNDFVDWSFSLPSQFKIRGKVGKFLLKKAAEKHLPAEIIHRNKKGFAIPVARWLKGPLRGMLQQELANSPLWESKAISRETFVHWAERHDAGAEDHSKALWAFLVLSNWVGRENIRV